MKVLYVTLHNPAFAAGGAEKILCETCLGIRETYGVEVAAAVNRGGLSERLEEEKVPIFYLEWSKLKTLKTVRILKKAIREWKPDVIHCFHRYPVFLLSAFIKPKAKVLFTEQVMHQNKRFFFRYGDFAAGCHESVRKNLVDYYGVPADRTATIPNAVPEQKANPVKLEVIRRRFPAEPGLSTVFFPGRLHEQKGHTYLIDAVAQMEEQDRRKIRILLAGDGPWENRLRAQVRKQGVEEQFVFLGYAREIPEYLALCDFVVLPSLWEGLPLVIPESYSAHKAVLASDIPGNRESIRPGETGDLVPVKNPEALAAALKQWIDSPEKVKAMGEKAYGWWREEFSLERMIRLNYELYQKLIMEPS